MEAMAKADEKTFTSKEYQTVAAEFQAAGMSLTFNSLNFNLK
jgi:hypothetical protein